MFDILKSLSYEIYFYYATAHSFIPGLNYIFGKISMQGVNDLEDVEVAKKNQRKEKLSISVLYVEDEDDIRVPASEMLHRRVETVYLAKDGQQGIEMYNEHLPDIIITDIRMPTMDGLKMIGEIRKENPNVKVIIMSAHSDTEFLTNAIDLGVAKYLIKPISSKILFEAIEEFYRQIQTERLRLEVEEEKRKLHETRNKIYSIIGHDLKGPMGSMGMVLDILIEKDEMPEENRELLLKELSNSAYQMYYLLENLMDWARTGDLKCNRKKLNLHDIAEKSKTFLNRLVKNKKIEIVNKIENNIFIEADERMVFTIFRNLISNALKFTNENGIIDIEYRDNGEFIETIIKDNGVGIPKDKVQGIFNESKDKTTLGTNGEKGTGFGLIMCREFVEANEGKIWVESEVGIGSKFIFTLKKYNLQK